MWSAAIERRAWLRRLAPPHALWLGPGGLWDHGPRPGWRHQPAAPRHHASFDAWCQAHPGRACRLALSGWLLHELLLDAQLPLADDGSRLAAARSLLQHYHGEAAAHWPLAAWHAGGRHGVSALHGAALDVLQASAGRAGVALQRVSPAWSLALPWAQQQQPALAGAASARLLVVDGALVTQIDLAGGRLQQLLQRRLASTQPAALAALVADLPPAACSLAVGHGLSAPWSAGPAGLQALGSLAGAVPPTPWRTDPPLRRAA